MAEINRSTQRQISANYSGGYPRRRRKKGGISPLLACGLVAILVCGGLYVKGILTAPPNTDQPPAPDLSQAPGTDISPSSSTSAPPSGLSSAPSPEAYVFGTPLEESKPEEDDHAFDNAVFLGDSRTEGLQLWGGIKAGDYFWSRGMSVFRVDDENYTFDVDGEVLTMVGVLEKKQYDKVYIMIGVNELGYPSISYEKGLREFLDKVIAAQPDAVIYLQTLPPLNDALARQYLASYERNENVNTFNEAIVRVAAEKEVVLLNTAEAYRDEDGQLPAELTYDGCHFSMSGYAIWADYLRCHIMDPELYFDSHSALTE